VFPNACERLGQSHYGESPLREGAFLVPRGRLAQEEATGSKLFVDEIVNLHPGAWASALVISNQERAAMRRLTVTCVLAEARRCTIETALSVMTT
jgi:hypothetical protein